MPGFEKLASKAEIFRSRSVWAGPRQQATHRAVQLVRSCEHYLDALTRVTLDGVPSTPSQTA
jgi:hypothetical protein